MLEADVKLEGYMPEILYLHRKSCEGLTGPPGEKVGSIMSAKRTCVRITVTRTKRLKSFWLHFSKGRHPLTWLMRKG